MNSFSTVDFVIAALIALAVIFVMRKLLKKGSCCGCESSSSCSSGDSCSCSSAQKMVADMEQRLKD